MKFLTIRFFAALLTFIVGVIAASLWFFYPSPKSKDHPSLIAQPPTQTRSEEILGVLMPNGVWGDAGQLGRFDRSEAIRVLREAQVEARDERAVSIAFLLAAAGHDYEANREMLLGALSRCASQPYPQEAQCSYFIADYLMELCRRGDASLFRPIFNVSDKADGAFSQSLGAFYSDMLWEKPEQFIKALESRPKKEQREICYQAGVEDGGGMNEGRWRDIRESLNHMSAQSNNALVPVARTCMPGVEAGYKRAMGNNESMKGK